MIAHRVTAGAETTSNSILVLTVARGAGVADGDVLVAWVGCTKAGTTAAVITPPAGWTALLTTTDLSSDASTLNCYLRVASSEPASQNWTKDTGTGRLCVSISAYTGVDTAAPVVAGEASAAELTANTTTRTTPVESTAGARWIMAAHFASTATTFSAFTSQTVRRNVTTTNSSMAVTDSNGDVAAGNVSRSCTASISDDAGVNAIVALNPAVGGINLTVPPTKLNLRLPAALLAEGVNLVIPAARQTIAARAPAPAAPPVFNAAGTARAATANLTTLDWGTHQAGDIGVLVVESAGTEPATLLAGSEAGFTQVPGSPLTVGTVAAGTSLTVFECRATSSSMAVPVVADTGDHTGGIIFTVRGARTVGSAISASAGATKPTASTSTQWPAATTSTGNCLILCIGTRDDDLATAAWSAPSNTALTGVTIRLDFGHILANGGGVVVISGVKTAAGPTGQTTATVRSSINTMLTLAVEGAIAVNQPPVASFTTEPFPGLHIEFLSTSTDPDGTVNAQAEWDFGDATGTTTSANPVGHTYPAAGTYTVVLTVTDNNGATDSETRQITVDADPPAPPVSQFTFTPTGLAVTFDSSESYDPDGTITGWAWTFGDGQTSALANPQNTYATGGTYTVELVVTDNNAQTGSSTQNVTVNAAGEGLFIPRVGGTQYYPRVGGTRHYPRVGAPGAPPPSGGMFTDILVTGDSMSNGSGESTVSLKWFNVLCDMIETETGTRPTVRMYGRGGTRLGTAGFMQGGAKPKFTVDGGAIPASVTAVTITPEDPELDLCEDGSGTILNCVLTGVPGKITRLNSLHSNPIRFTRTTAGSEVAAGGPQTLTHVPGETYRGAVWLEFGPHNNRNDGMPSVYRPTHSLSTSGGLTYVTNTLAAMAAYCQEPQERYACIGLSSGPTVKHRTNGNTTDPINPEWTELFGADGLGGATGAIRSTMGTTHWVDIRPRLINTGAGGAYDLGGITPTADDIKAAGDGGLYPGPSLRPSTDGVGHLNRYGQYSIALDTFNFMNANNWFPA